MCHHTIAQWKAGIEQYNYIGSPLAGAFVPVCHMQSSSDWYAELRYNYEDVQTFSVYGGKKITKGNDFHYSVTPMMGFSAGRFTGISFAANIEAEWKKFYLSSETQYSIATKRVSKDFFFNWSEIGYNITSFFFSGLTVQYTRQPGKIIFEPGFLTGLTLNKVSFPVYIFRPFRSGCYFISGVIYEYSFSGKNKQAN